jgi:hypothetical protein
MDLESQPVSLRFNQRLGGRNVLVGMLKVTYPCFTRDWQKGKRLVFSALQLNEDAFDVSFHSVTTGRY